MTAVTAYPEGDLWVLDCARCGLVAITSDAEVDKAMALHDCVEVSA